MKLKALKLRNFRGYKSETLIEFNDMTAFIGKNDAGKSSILEALEIFFNNDTVSIDRDDLCKEALSAGDSELDITCIFDNLPSTLVIDAANPTSLTSEYLLNQNGDLEIKKVYACTAASPRHKVFIVAHYPTADKYTDLHQLKRTELRSRAAELGINATEYNANLNSSIRKAIWANSPDLMLSNTSVQIDKEDSKKIWEVLETWMPIYALFQSDRKSKEEDKEITDPMKIAIKEALKDVAEEIRIVQDKVKAKAIDVAERTLQKLQEMNPGLANHLIPDFKADPKWNSIFNLTLSSDNGIPINKRGSGVRRLVVLNFFRAEAERRRSEVNNPSIIYAFEEPETSQHPEHQKMLVKAFQDLVNSPDSQVIITTHTPALGGLISNSDLRLVTKDSSENVVVEHGVAATYEKIAATLGVLPDPLAAQIQLLVCVEGPHDISFLKNITPVVRAANPHLPDLTSDPRVAILPLGGSTLKEWVNNNYLRGLGIPEFHLYDRDDPHNPKYQDAVNQVLSRGSGYHALLTGKREMENYIHHDAINRVLGLSLAAYGDFDDVPSLVAEATHVLGGSPHAWSAISEEDRKKKSSRAKKRLNQAVVQQMTTSEISTIDPHGEVVSWFQEIGTRLS